MNPTLAGVLALLIFSLGTITVVQIQTLPPFALAAISMALGGLTILAQQIICKKPVLAYWRQPLWVYLWVTTGIGVYTVLLLTALQIAPPFEVNALNYSWPVLLVFLSAFFGGGGLGPMRIIGILMGFAGSALILMPQESFGAFNFSLGHGVGLLGAFIWAIYSIYARKHPYPSEFIGIVFLLSAAMCWILHVIYEEPLSQIPNAREIFFIMAFGMTRFCYVLWDFGMKKGNVILLGSLSYFVPLLSVCFFVIFGYRAQTPMVAWGALLIVLGCLVVNMRHLLPLWPKIRKKQA